MTPLEPSPPAPEIRWWRARPRAGAGVAAVLFAVLVALRVVDRDAHDGLAVLVVVPVAILGLLFGRRVGVAAAAGGLAFVAGWAIAAGASLGPGGWTALILPPVAVGIVAGTGGEALAVGARYRRLTGEAHRRQQRTTERTETVVQSLVAAKWSFEAGRTEEGLVVLTDALAAAERLVVDLVRIPASGPAPDPGPGPAPAPAVDLTERLSRSIPPAGPPARRS